MVLLIADNKKLSLDYIEKKTEMNMSVLWILYKGEVI